MPLQWIQEPRFAARGVAGTFYKIFPFSNSEQFAATESYLDDTGQLITRPIGGQFDSVEDAQKACEAAFTQAGKTVQAK